MQHTQATGMSLTISVDELGQELERRRAERGLSLRQVEEETGVSAATLSRIERSSGTPDLEIIDKLARWLGVIVHAAGGSKRGTGSDEELKRTIEVHLRANKNIPPALARNIAETFDLVMRLEL